MKELYYENQGTNTYLVYDIGENDAVDTMSLGMLTNNKIAGLAQTVFMQMDAQKYIKFNVSAIGMAPLSSIIGTILIIKTIKYLKIILSNKKYQLLSTILLVIYHNI